MAPPPDNLMLSDDRWLRQYMDAARGELDALGANTTPPRIVRAVPERSRLVVPLAVALGLVVLAALLLI